MSKIQITRPDEYSNRARDFQLFIDGKPAGTIANNSTITIEVSPGNHMIQAKIDWCSSPELPIHLTSGTIQKVGVSGFKYGQYLRFAVFGILIFHFILNAVYHFEYLILLAFPLFLFFVYYLTLGRSKYLNIAIK